MSQGGVIFSYKCREIETKKYFNKEEYGVVIYIF